MMILLVEISCCGRCVSVVILRLSICRYGDDLLSKLVPSLASLSTNLENLEWLESLSSTVGDLVYIYIYICSADFLKNALIFIYNVYSHCCNKMCQHNKVQDSQLY